MYWLVLAFNIPEKNWRLAPVVTDDKVISIPLFYPNFLGSSNC